MENSSIEKISAYNRVCEKFIQACQESKLEPVDCLLAIGRFLNVPIGTGKPNSSANLTGSGPASGQLTKAEMDRVKKEARESKARRLGLSPSEVNLTPKEISDAKAEARRKRPLQGSPTPSTPSQKVGALSKGEVNLDNSRKVDKPDRRVESMKTGLRATALTKLKSCRNMCLLALPNKLEDPRLIHLVAYSNHFNRLSHQWKAFQESYETHSMQNPLRELPDPWKLPLSGFLLTEATKGLKIQPDSPGTFILQSDQGSFWFRDLPSKVCPAELSEPLSKEALHEFVGALGNSN